MTPLAIFGLGVPELLIILAVVLLLFGGSRLAGLGKSTGRALKEFKEETKGLKPGETAPEPTTPAQIPPPATYPPATNLQDPNTQAQNTQWQQPPTANPSEPDVRRDV